MNEMEKFLNFCAVIKIRRSYDEDLLKFIQLMKSVGFLNEYINYFEQNCCYDEKFNEFSESRFWHLVKLNKGNPNDTCIEFQWSKGFTWGNVKDYLSYDKEIEVLNVDELIKACNKQELFKMNYKYTSFKNELQNKESISDLDEFLNFYEWALVKFPDGKYNIKDEQCNTFDFEENTTFESVLNRVYFRMLDYFIDEDDIKSLIKEDNFNYVKETFDSYIKTGEELKVLDNDRKQSYSNIFQEIVNESLGKNDIEINNNI